MEANGISPGPPGQTPPAPPSAPPEKGKGYKKAAGPLAVLAALLAKFKLAL